MATNKRIDTLNAELKIQEAINSSITGRFNKQKREEGELKIKQIERNLAEAKYLDLLKQIKKAHDDGNIAEETRLKNTERAALNDIATAEKKLVKEQQSIKNQGSLLALLTKSYWYQTGILKVLNDQDKIIRQTILNLGLSGNKAFEMRKSFETAAANAALIGANLADIAKIQTGFADETGRAQVLSAEMLHNVLLIGKGTGIGVEQAVKLASQFQIMGIDTKRTMEYVQGVVDTSERMGINTTKVLNNIANNFKKLQTMSFNSGVQGYAKMAEYAEQMKMDMGEAISSSKMANNLEKSIDLAAQLQVMGGEFAKVDPFQMLYLSRNAPDEFAKRMNEMTKGLVTFRKMADGTFQKFISPADRDRMEAVAKATGVSIENLTEQTLRMADASKMKQMLLGTGFSAKDKELITGQATFDTKLGKFLVQVGTARKDISQLTAEDVKALQVQQSVLEVRAKDALTFNESLQSMVDALKTTLIPLMRGMTAVLEPFRKFATILSNTSDGFKNALGGFGKFLGGVLLLQAASKLLVGTYNTIMLGIAAARGTSFTPRSGSLLNWGGGQSRNKTTGRFTSSKNAGLGGMRAGVGLGAAALGAGAGIGIAAGGISLLANAMQGLDTEKAKILKDIINTLGILEGVGMIAATILMAFSPALVTVGGAAAAATPGLLGLGAAIALVGTGIGIAGAGLGYMFKGIGEIVSGVGSVISGIGTAATGVASLVTSFSSIDKSSLSTLTAFADTAPKFSLIGDAFKQISTVLSGSKEDFSAVESAINAISNMNTSKGSAFSQLAELLSKPIQVEFADKKVAIVSNITLELDGEKLMQKAYKSDVRIQRDIDVKLNKLGK